LRYDSGKFYGICVNIGAAGYSIGGRGQFKALQKINSSIQLNKSTEGALNAKFGIGSALLIGSIKLQIPVGKVEFHIINAKIPFLLSLNNMDCLKIFPNNLENILVT